MRRCSVLFLGVVMSGWPALAQTVVGIVVDGRNLPSGAPHRILIEDRVCKKKLGPFPMNSGDRLNVRVCTADSGYGNVRVKNTTTNAPWIEVRQASPEAPIALTR